MTLARPRLLGAGLAAALAASTLLVTPPAAHAAPVFTDLTVDPEINTYIVAGTCTETGPSDPATPPTPLTENGVPVATSVTATISAKADDEATDTITATSTLQATSSATTAGGLPASVTTTFSGTTTTTAAKSTPECGLQSSAALNVGFTFTTPVALWATLRVKHKGPGDIEAYIHNSTGEGYQSTAGNAFGGDGSTTVLLPAGTYDGYVAGSVGGETMTASSATVSGSASITFAQPGSASKAPSGKASKYVALPGARTCATHNATATLTTKKKRIKQIDKVTFTVNGKKAATLKGKKLKRGKAVALPLADNAAADITATVRLKSGKKRTVDAAYLACTS